jgi:hypothetical protein
LAGGRGVGGCHRPVSAQSVNRRLISGKSGVTVDEEAQAFAIVLARPLAVPRLTPRIVGVEMQAPERLPAAMVTSFDVAARAMALADRRAAIRALSELLAHAFPSLLTRSNAADAVANSVCRAQ